MRNVYVDITNQCTFDPPHGNTITTNTTLNIIYGGEVIHQEELYVYSNGIFNLPYNISNIITDCSNMFRGCMNFNQPVTIGNNVTNTAYMFVGCMKFNQPVTIPDNVTNTAFMFRGCENFNQPVTIPDNVTNTAYMFADCYILNQNIYIKSINITNVRNMLDWHNASKQINLFCTNLASLNKTTEETSLTGTEITWTAMTNGYYSEKYNIYLYNNLPVGI